MLHDLPHNLQSWENGALIASRSYDNANQVLGWGYDALDDPWGTPQLGDVRQRFGFTGELHDPALGLVNLRARWYATSEGRFCQRDPFAGCPERPYSQHEYAYSLFRHPRHCRSSARSAG